ncbi:MAG: Sec-independent protein translocase protein TatB [Burkholderiaceae bacterium]|jgi:sec-independent protein translocase protein TatB|nr:Sec-independent protein translocase protein TatB [Burkholderiaceae bacterium]MDH5208203.1 Sec-independent protein translocase protein TatB [Burkholderiaceae bacterium]
MFDFSFGELAVIGAVALVVLGPERLPKVARMAGEWAGKAQRYVSQVKTDITREMEVAELQKLQQQARDVARSIETSVQGGVASIQSELDSTANSLNSGLQDASGGGSGSGTGDYSWDAAGDNWASSRFRRRYKPGPSVDDLSEEIAKLKRQLAMPEATGHSRHKYAPRARMNRPRIRR